MTDKINPDSRGIENKKTNAVIIIALAGICLFHIIHNCLWIQNDVLSWYPEKYYQLAYKNEIFFSFQKLVHSDQSLPEKLVSTLKLVRIEVGWAWGTLFYLFTAAFNLLWGNSTQVSLLSNLPIFVLIIISTFLLGKEICGQYCGLLAAFLVSFYPGIYGMSRSYGVDFPLIAMVVLSIYVLIAKDVTKFKYSLLFALALGLTLLVKIVGIYFIIGPLVYVFYRHIRGIIENRPKGGSLKIPLLRLFLPLFLFIVAPLVILSLGWGRGRLHYLLGNLNLFAFLSFCRRRHFYDICLYSPEDIRNILFYASEIVYSISRLLFPFFLAGFFFILRNKIKHKIVIYLWIIVPYVIFTLNINKWGRYYFPALPALALITASAIFLLKSRKLKVALITLIVSLSLAQFYDLSFGTGFLPKVLYGHPDYSFSAEPPEKTDEQKVVRMFMNAVSAQRPLKDCRILFVAPHGRIDLGKFEYIFQTEYPQVKFEKFFLAAPEYKDCDYILVINYSWNGYYTADVSFLKTPGYYGDFLKVSYPRYWMSDEDLAEAGDYFEKFQPVRSYFGKELFFHLCRNPRGQDK